MITIMIITIMNTLTNFRHIVTQSNCTEINTMTAERRKRVSKHQKVS